MQRIKFKRSNTAVVSVSKSVKRIQSPFFSNNLFKLRPLHLLNVRNRQDVQDFFNNGHLKGGIELVLAHYPSLFYYLLRKCGISFQESMALVEKKQLLVDGKFIAAISDLEYQHKWEDITNMKIEIQLEGNPKEEEKTSRSSSSSSSMLVPAENRWQHREYWFYHKPKGMNLKFDFAGPRSFVHAIPVSSGAVPIGICPPGLRQSMPGLMIISTDLSSLSLFRNHYYGNYGTYFIRFIQGTPNEEKRRIFELVERILNGNVTEEMIRQCDYLVPVVMKFASRRMRKTEVEDIQKKKAILMAEAENNNPHQQEDSNSSNISSLENQEEDPGGAAKKVFQARDVYSLFDFANNRDDVKNTSSKDSDNDDDDDVGSQEGILLQTPRFYTELWQAVKKIVEVVQCVSCGPFVLNDSNNLPTTSTSLSNNEEVFGTSALSSRSLILRRRESRLLSDDELERFFMFEKRLKTGNLLSTLREVQQ